MVFNTHLPPPYSDSVHLRDVCGVIHIEEWPECCPIAMEHDIQVGFFLLFRNSYTSSSQETDFILSTAKLLALLGIDHLGQLAVLLPVLPAYGWHCQQGGIYLSPSLGTLGRTL